MFAYIIIQAYRLTFYSIVTFLCFAGFFTLIQSVWLGEINVYLGLNALWVGFFYIWNLLTAEISIDVLSYFEAKQPDRDYYTLTRIMERMKKFDKQSI
jgi:hypothetical protein